MELKIPSEGTRNELKEAVLSFFCSTPARHSRWWLDPHCLDPRTGIAKYDSQTSGHFDLIQIRFVGDDKLTYSRVDSKTPCARGDWDWMLLAEFKLRRLYGQIACAD